MPIKPSWPSIQSHDCCIAASMTIRGADPKIPFDKRHLVNGIIPYKALIPRLRQCPLLTGCHVPPAQCQLLTQRQLTSPADRASSPATIYPPKAVLFSVMSPSLNCAMPCRLSARIEGVLAASMAHCQASAVSTASPGRTPANLESPVKRQMFDRLVRGAIFTQPN